MKSLRLAAIVWIAISLHSEPPTHVVIMHTNDLHGHVLAVKGSGGMPELATVVHQNHPDLLLDAGDMYFGTMISNTFKGEPMIAAMNALGYNAAAVGNHEFDFGIEILGERIRQAHFPLLSANTTSPLATMGDVTILNVKGIRIGVIGLTTQEIMKTGHPNNLRNVVVADPVIGAAKGMAKLRGKVDFTIFLTHISPEEEINLAKAFPEVRLIIGGHSHDPLEKPLQVGNTTIVRTGVYAKYVGRTDLTFNDKTLAAVEDHLIPLEGVEPDPEILSLVQPYENRISKDLDNVVGVATGDLTRSLSEESHVGDLVADAMRDAAGTQIALNNAGSIRVPISKGPITGRNIYDVVPFDNALVTMKLSGAQIRKILGHIVMNVSGIRVRLNPDRPVGQRLVSATLSDGSPIIAATLYTVTTNDFLLAGGDGFPEFKEGLEIHDTGQLLREAVTAYIRKLKTIEPKLDGRIQIIN